MCNVVYGLKVVLSVLVVTGLFLLSLKSGDIYIINESKLSDQRTNYIMKQHFRHDNSLLTQLVRPMTSLAPFKGTNQKPTAV